MPQHGARTASSVSSFGTLGSSSGTFEHITSSAAAGLGQTGAGTRHLPEAKMCCQAELSCVRAKALLLLSLAQAHNSGSDAAGNAKAVHSQSPGTTVSTHQPVS
jgi:hypothetical protein